MIPSLRLLASFSACALASSARAEVKLIEKPDHIRVEIDGQLFTEYHFTGARRPYLYPIIGPTGAGMTRDWPLKEGTPGEETDHVHHKGLWFGHRHVNGVGFWEDRAKAGVKIGQIQHEKFLEVKGGAEQGTIRARNKWALDEGGEIICYDERTIRVHDGKSGRVLDFDVTIYAGEKDVVFGDDKDGAMAIRVAETMRVDKPKVKGQKTAPVGEGHILNSEGHKDGEAWGKRAKWCDYFGPVQGKTVGVAMFDHPSNPRHPTWWHVRTYGLFAANAFGQAQFEKLPGKQAGAYTIPAGKNATFRYRFYFHEGDPAQAKVAERYDDYVKSTK